MSERMSTIPDDVATAAPAFPPPMPAVSFGDADAIESSGARAFAPPTAAFGAGDPMALVAHGDDAETPGVLGVSGAARPPATAERRGPSIWSIVVVAAALAVTLGAIARLRLADANDAQPAAPFAVEPESGVAAPPVEPVTDPTLDEVTAPDGESVEPAAGPSSDVVDATEEPIEEPIDDAPVVAVESTDDTDAPSDADADDLDAAGAADDLDGAVPDVAELADDRADADTDTDTESQGEADADSAASDTDANAADGQAVAGSEGDPVVEAEPVAAQNLALFLDGQIVLGGAVPTREAADLLVERAAELVGAENVVDSFVIDPNAPEPTNTTLAVDDTVAFATDSAQMPQPTPTFLEVGLALLNAEPNARLVLTGYTDSLGSEFVNVVLSEQRAETVKQWFVDNGIDPSRLDAVGSGAAAPVASNDTPAGRRENRRLEFEFTDLLTTS